MLTVLIGTGTSVYPADQITKGRITISHFTTEKTEAANRLYQIKNTPGK